MFGWGPATRIYLAAGATDMRKGFEGLYGLVRDHLESEPRRSGRGGNIRDGNNCRRACREWNA